MQDIEEAAEKAKILNFINKTDKGFQTNVDWFRMNWDQIKLDADFNPGMNSAARKIKCTFL